VDPNGAIRWGSGNAPGRRLAETPVLLCHSLRRDPGAPAGVGGRESLRGRAGGAGTGTSNIGPVGACRETGGAGWPVYHFVYHESRQGPLGSVSTLFGQKEKPLI
jgi:hypothetical protein